MIIMIYSNTSLIFFISEISNCFYTYGIIFIFSVS
nr:MAG TPA_asm: hypothetical protein [Caudoviricetes sp.]